MMMETTTMTAEAPLTFITTPATTMTTIVGNTVGMKTTTPLSPQGSTAKARAGAGMGSKATTMTATTTTATMTMTTTITTTTTLMAMTTRRR